MKIDRRDREDEAFLAESARMAKARNVDPATFLHLDQAVGRWNYVRIANEIAARIPPGRLLDWGCGYGQMTYLLRRRGFQVTAFDVVPEGSRHPDLPLCRDLAVVRTTHPTKLPFADGSFDVVLSCGVLEHVDEFSQPGNELLSLREIHRVLGADGLFVIYQLPQRLAWQEAITRRLRIGYSHPRRFDAGEIRALLSSTGYRIERLRRNNLLPKNLTGVPEPLRAVYSRFSRAVIDADDALCRIPGLNRLAGVLELDARRLPG